MERAVQPVLMQCSTTCGCPACMDQTSFLLNPAETETLGLLLKPPGLSVCYSVLFWSSRLTMDKSMVSFCQLRLCWTILTFDKSICNLVCLCLVWTIFNSKLFLDYDDFGH